MHGFLPTQIGEKDYVFGYGKLSKKVLRPDGQWSDYLPGHELQKKNGLETNNCTSYSTLNCLEILYKFHTGEELNYSERFTGLMAGTRPPGNDLNTVCQAIRKNGVILEEDLPFLDTFSTLEEYYNPDPMDEDLKEKGKNWLKVWGFKHEWVFPFYLTLQTKQIMLMEALKYSPLAVSVFGWRRNENGDYFKNEGDVDNHVCTLYGYEKGVRWFVLDSYDNSLKILEWNYDFGQAKKFHLGSPEVSLLEWIKRLFGN